MNEASLGQVDRCVSVPKRIQRKRTKGWRMPPNTIYVGRGSKWGNPFTIAEHGAEEAVYLYSMEIFNPNSRLGFNIEDIEELRGKNLADWCCLDEPCHADVLLELANS